MKNTIKLKTLTTNDKMISYVDYTCMPCRQLKCMSLALSIWLCRDFEHCRFPVVTRQAVS